MRYDAFWDSKLCSQSVIVLTFDSSTGWKSLYMYDNVCVYIYI